MAALYPRHLSTNDNIQISFGVLATVLGLGTLLTALGLWRCCFRSPSAGKSDAGDSVLPYCSYKVKRQNTNDLEQQLFDNSTSCSNECTPSRGPIQARINLHEFPLFVQGYSGTWYNESTTTKTGSFRFQYSGHGKQL